MSSSFENVVPSKQLISYLSIPMVVEGGAPPEDATAGPPIINMRIDLQTGNIVVGQKFISIPELVRSCLLP